MLKFEKLQNILSKIIFFSYIWGSILIYMYLFPKEYQLYFRQIIFIAGF